MKSAFSRIPPHLFPFQNRPGYFVLYYGDVHFGSLWECVGYDQGFFIIPNYHLKEVQALTRDQINPENFRQLGVEIQDHRVIKEVLEDKTQFHHEPVKSIHTQGQKFSRMFVFGAAASTFSVFGENRMRFRQEPYNPPTGFEVFDEKYQRFYEKYPAALQSISEFESKNKDIEGCLDDEWRAYKDRYSPDVVTRHINLQFYLQEMFLTISKEVISKEMRHSLYSLFCKKLTRQLNNDNSQVDVLVSFNYDTILDHYIEDFTRQFERMNDYFDWQTRNIVLFKPHGSANWGWPFKQEKIDNMTRADLVKALFDQKAEPWEIYYNLLGEFSETVEYGSWGIEGKLSLNKNLIRIIREGEPDTATAFPALLMPYRDKDEFVMPYQMQHALNTCFNAVNELFLIGWKGNEELFNRKMKEHAHNLKRIIIVNPDATAVKGNLEKAGFNLANYEVSIIPTFEDFVINHFE